MNNDAMSTAVFVGTGAALMLGVLAVRVLIARNTAAAATRRIGMAETSPEATFIGDLTISTWHGRRQGRRPGRLEFFAWGVRLDQVATLLHPVWEVRYEELVAADAVNASPLILLPLNQGIRFRTPDGISVPMIFWTTDRDRIFDMLEQHGAPVNRTAAPLPPFA